MRAPFGSRANFGKDAYARIERDIKYYPLLHVRERGGRKELKPIGSENKKLQYLFSL